jgi:hypothetical protein
MSIPKTTYQYVSSGQYVDQLQFAFLETWSFQRGVIFEQERKSFQIEYRELSSLKMPRTEQQEKRMGELLNASSLNNGLLLDKDGRFHPTAIKINTFNSDSPESNKILSILSTEALDVPMWVCAPLYRDAIVFYNSNAEIISVLNICFTCKYMVTKEFHHVNADVKAYDELKQLFLEIGHEIEGDL